VKDRKDITIPFWKEHIDRILLTNDKAVLKNHGTISNQEMEAIVEEKYETFNERRKQREANEADLQDLKDVEQQLKEKK
jgi:hypothetical protein